MKIISVIIPFHRKINLLKEAVKSVNNQFLPYNYCFEIIIGNDSSYEDYEIFSKLIGQIDQIHKLIIAKNFKDKGAGNSRNAALEKASGDYISFLDSDDTWKPHKTIMQLNLLLDDTDFVSTSYQINYSNIKFEPAEKKQFKDNIFFSNRPIGTSTVMVKSKYIMQSRFDNIKFCQDLLFWHSVFKKNSGLKYKTINYSLVNYSPNGRTSEYTFIDFIKYYWLATKKGKLSIFSRIYSLSIYIIRGSKNSIKRNLININIIKSKTLKKFFKIIISNNFLNPFFYYYYIKENIFYDLKNKKNTFLKLNFNSKNYQKKYSSSVHYVASNTEIVKNSLKTLKKFVYEFRLNLEEFQFIDLGSGKGKVISIILSEFSLLTIKYPCIGIEISNRLCKIARNNLESATANYKIINKDCKYINNIIDSKNIILYLYNPFGRDQLKEIISKLTECEFIFIVYVEPIHEETLLNLGFTNLFKKKSLFKLKNRSYSILCKVKNNKIFN